MMSITATGANAGAQDKGVAPCIIRLLHVPARQGADDANSPSHAATKVSCYAVAYISLLSSCQIERHIQRLFC